MARTWPQDWEARKAGEGCPFCAEGRVESNEYGARFFEDRYCDAYLQRRGPAPGYSIVVFRGRHVADAIDLTEPELFAFWTEVRKVAKLVDGVFQPCQLNYQVLGNAVPHVHVHIVPRYLDDAAPEAPLPFDMKVVPRDEFEARLAELKDAARSVRPSFPVIHHGLSADMFVIRGGKFLVLTRGAGVGQGLNYLPGGAVDSGEDTLEAAVRETREECGLQVRDVSLLRVWTYAAANGWETIHATYAGYSDSGDVVLSHEHTGYEWTTPDEYIERWCPEEYERTFPRFANFFRQVRMNCELVRQRL